MREATPTAEQFRKLQILAGGCILITPGRRDWGPLLKRGWVEHPDPDDHDKRFLPPLRITAAGYEACARGATMHGLPDLAEIAPRPRQHNESPVVTRLKAELDQARAEAREQRGLANAHRRCLETIGRVLDSAEIPR